MSYKIGIAKSNRARCRRNEYTHNGKKIAKDELRFGEEIHYPGRQYTGCAWRHWGCVSADQIFAIRNTIRTTEGVYDWSRIEGYDEIGKYQSKIQRVITQGFIDPEDIMEDLEQKVLGGLGDGAKVAGGSAKTVKVETGNVVKLKEKPYQPGTPYGTR